MKVNRPLMIVASIAACLVVVLGFQAATISSASAKSTEEVNVYSARKAELIAPLLEQFSEKTGITVNLITGKDDALLKRLEVEGKGSPADVLITVDAGRLYRAKTAGLLQALDNKTLNNAIPESFRDSDNQWFGISLRARPIFYVKDKVDPSELSSYEALSNDKWKGRICIRSSSNIYNQSLIGSMIAANGESATENWANGLVANFARPPSGGDTDQLKAAAAGVCDLAIANTYYYGRLVKSDNADNNKVASKLAIFWPNQDGRGTHVNVSGVGLTKSSKNKDNAIKLMEFLVSEPAQTWYAETNNEYPVVANVTIDPIQASWGNFKRDTIPLTKLGENNRKAVELMDRAGWK